jgi:hypothetical protein
MSWCRAQSGTFDQKFSVLYFGGALSDERSEQIMSYNDSYTNTWQQDESMSWKRKICSKTLWLNVQSGTMIQMEVLIFAINLSYDQDLNTQA